MRWTGWIGALLLAAACGGCAGVGVDFDAAEDFSSYRTWAWLPRLEAPPEPYATGPEGLAEEIELRTQQALAAQGFDRVEVEEEPDFFVTYHVEIHTEIVTVHEQQAQQTLQSSTESPSSGVTRSELRRRIYQRGHLVIDVADGDDRQLVWRGETESKYRGSWKPHARGAVFKILEQFPPEPAVASREALPAPEGADS